MSFMVRRSLVLIAAGTALGPFLPLSALLAQTSGQPLASQAVLTSLSTKLDSKKSKVGDPVVVKTLSPFKLNDGSVLPSGTKISGKVTEVDPKSAGTAKLGIEFDQLEKKGSAPMPIHGTVVGVAPVPDLGGGGGAAANDLPTRGTAAQQAAQTGMGVGGNAGPETIAPGSSIKGVELGSQPAADGSSVLQSSEKDIKLEGGTRLEIGLSAK